MKRALIVYYSNTGNTEVIADDIYTYISKKYVTDMIEVQDFDINLINQYEVVFLGCPASGAEELEENVFLPFYLTVKDYLKNNQVIKAEELLSQCELSLGNYEEVEKITSEIFLSTCGTMINTNAIQVRAFLRTNRVKDALDLIDWSINFSRSIVKDEETFLNVVFMFAFMKACCEKILNLDYSKTISFLIENRDKTSGFKSVNDGLKFYNNKHIILASETGDIKNDILKEINEYKKDKVSGYQHAFDIFNEIYGE